MNKEEIKAKIKALVQLYNNEAESNPKIDTYEYDGKTLRAVNTDRIGLATVSFEIEEIEENEDPVAKLKSRMTRDYGWFSIDMCGAKDCWVPSGLNC